MPTVNSSLWSKRAAAHQQRVAEWADRFVQRRSCGERHPVEDFLFTYYTFSPSKLKSWLPALGESWEVDATALTSYPEFENKECHRGGGELRLDASKIPASTLRLAQFIANLSQQILLRPGRYRCYGMHEWAMVYGQSTEEVRHQGYELRLAPSDLKRFVDTQPIVCSHYDAFRFFTPSARGFNTLQPTLESRLHQEQPACLHANMDIYKWAYKLWPWCGSELVGEAFTLAKRGREFDMRASPYDLSSLGFQPIRIETSDGRDEYEHEQRQLTEESIPLRTRLLEAAKAVLS